MWRKFFIGVCIALIVFGVSAELFELALNGIGDLIENLLSLLFIGVNSHA